MRCARCAVVRRATRSRRPTSHDRSRFIGAARPADGRPAFRRRLGARGRRRAGPRRSDGVRRRRRRGADDGRRQRERDGRAQRIRHRLPAHYRSRRGARRLHATALPGPRRPARARRGRLPDRRARDDAVRRADHPRRGVLPRLLQGPQTHRAEGLTRRSRPTPDLSSPESSNMLQAYRRHAAERAALGIPPLPLSAAQVTELIELIKAPPAGEEAFLLELLTHRVPPGTMVGGFNVHPLIELLDYAEVAGAAAAALKKTLLMFDYFNDVAAKARAGNARAKEVMQSWADAEWFTSRPAVPKTITVTVFKVPGETNTDDLSPAPDAWSRPDIPLHYLAMLKNSRPDAAFKPEEESKRGPIRFIDDLKKKGHIVAYVGDVVGTGSSRKSATNSVIWATGVDIPFVPNKRFGGVTLGGKIAPIFLNTQEDSGSLPIEVDVSMLEMGDVIDIHPYDGRVTKGGATVATFALKSDVLLDEVRAGGRINLIIGRSLTARAREALGLPASTAFRLPVAPKDTGKGYTLAQKIVGRACGLPDGHGIRPGTYCEPHMTTVGSQDTTGPMTRDELKDLACLGFSADLVMQSFCHTAAYPKPVDVKTHRELPAFISTRGGVSLRPGDGVIHLWLNRLLLPDTVGTGGDSHTRYPIGISFPAGSGLVAFAAATGVMPLDMPESVLVRFKGRMQPGVTLRDLVHAIPYVAIKQGLLTVAKAGKKNIFSGKILEIEGLPDLKVEQAFELSDASAERSAAGCTIKLNPEPIKEYLRSNIVLMKNMIADGYQRWKSTRL